MRDVLNATDARCGYLIESLAYLVKIVRMASTAQKMLTEFQF